MENQAAYNPDRRPLPDGWVQHYEPATKMWYYVQIQTTVARPTVTFNHPAGLIGGTAAGPQVPNPPIRHSPNDHTPSSSRRSQGMTVAQKLYASSGAASAPMINTNNITSLSTSVDAASTPSSPPASNRTSMLPTPTSASPLRSESSRPMSYLPRPRSRVHGIVNPHNNRPGAALYASASGVLYPSDNRGDRNPHRAATEAATTNTGPTGPEKLRSQSVGSVDPNSYSSFLRPRSTPHLVTKARAPPLDTSAQPGTSPPPLNLISPPSTSLLFSAENSLSSHKRPSSSPSPITPNGGHTYNHFGLNQQNVQLGRIDPPSLLAMLKTALSVNPIAESELRAVAYAQPNADYQAVVNALKKQQRYRPVMSTTSGVGVHRHPSLGIVDYQLLITEVGGLEIKAMLSQHTQQQAIIAYQQNMASDALEKKQDTLAQQQQLILNQHAQGQALVNSQLQQQQDMTLAQQQELLHQQSQEQAMLKLQMQQQQQHIFSQQQMALSQQAQVLKVQIQQQHQAAQQQAILNQQAEEQAALKLQLHQQQLHALQQHATHQQLLAQQSVPVNHSQPHQPNPSAHQWGQHQQQQSGPGTFMSSVMGGGPQQQAGGQGNPSIQQQVVSHFFDSVANLQGPGVSDPTASCATASGDAGNQVLMNSITQGLNGFNSGQDLSSGIFGPSGNLDFSTMVSGNATLTASMDFSSSGLDFSSFGSDDC